MKMIEKIEMAVEFIVKRNGNEWTSPTSIGNHVCGTGAHSASGSPICKKAVELGIMERNSRGWYRVLI